VHSACQLCFCDAAFLNLILDLKGDYSFGCSGIDFFKNPFIAQELIKVTANVCSVGAHFKFSFKLLSLSFAVASSFVSGFLALLYKTMQQVQTIIVYGKEHASDANGY
jgi:hypothetical protein